MVAERKETPGARLITRLEERIERFARVSHYILITGERGSGKTTVARNLHRRSDRAAKEFINLNCANLNRELLESELFGYEKGAFTGAGTAKAGLFEIASGGTLFLDEIGEIPLALQAKLLKAVEEKKIRRVGSNIERTVDARIVAATSANLAELVEQGKFRADLYDRLNILTLETVPLRYQKESIRPLLRAGLRSECAAVGRVRPFEISDEAFAELEGHDWPGNFRELHNFAVRLAVECFDHAVISAADVRRLLGERVDRQKTIDPSEKPEPKIPADVHRRTSDEDPATRVTVTFDPAVDDLDWIYLKAAAAVIQHVLRETTGNLRRAGLILGANHSTLSRILAKYNHRRESKNQALPHSDRAFEARAAGTA